MAAWGATVATTDGWGTAPGGANDPWGSVPSVAGNASGVTTRGAGDMKPAVQNNMDEKAGGDAAGFEHEA